MADWGQSGSQCERTLTLPMAVEALKHTKYVVASFQIRKAFCGQQWMWRDILVYPVVHKDCLSETRSYEKLEGEQSYCLYTEVN